MQALGSYEVDGDVIRIDTEFCTDVVSTCRKWAGSYAGGVWTVPATRLPELVPLLGSNFDDLVQVVVGMDKLTDGQGQTRIGWYVVAGRRGRDNKANVHAELLTGTIPPWGGSVKYPEVSPSDDATFRFWVARDFAVANQLTVVADPAAGFEPPNPLKEFTDEQILAEVRRRKLAA